MEKKQRRGEGVTPRRERGRGEGREERKAAQPVLALVSNPTCATSCDPEAGGTDGTRASSLSPLRASFPAWGTEG